MRVVRVEIMAKLVLGEKDVDLQNPTVSDELVAHVKNNEPAIMEMIRSRSKDYFPAEYNVFTVLRSGSDAHQLAVEIWVVDPSIRWWGGLFARRAWHVILPVLARIAQGAINDRLDPVHAIVQENSAKVSIYGATRSWKDPVILAAIVMLVTSAYWLFVHRLLTAQLP